jgi:regulator of protease activity HflC (stomatin/prohibitin superfamily)
MAQLKRYGVFTHLRSEASGYVRFYKKGAPVSSGRGLAFWFRPDGASIAEILMDDRELMFIIKGQSSDYQDLSVQGTVIWRVRDAGVLAERVDYTIDLKTGLHINKPEDRIEAVLNGLVREFADTWLKNRDVRAVLEAGLAPLQAHIGAGFADNRTLGGMGLEIVNVHISALVPGAELSRALRAPAFESLQQKADKATFSRRALAVEKERAIAENELGNRIELAARRKQLIAREDENARSEAEAVAAAKQIGVEASAAAIVVGAEAEAKRIRYVEQAAADMQAARMAAIADVSPAVLFALAAQEFAGKLDHVDSLNINPDMLAGLIGQARAALAPVNGDAEK